MSPSTSDTRNRHVLFLSEADLFAISIAASEMSTPVASNPFPARYIT